VLRVYDDESGAELAAKVFPDGAALREISFPSRGTARPAWRRCWTWPSSSPVVDFSLARFATDGALQRDRPGGGPAAAAPGRQTPRALPEAVAAAPAQPCSRDEGRRFLQKKRQLREESVLGAAPGHARERAVQLGARAPQHSL
jgi:hypothetical protein